MAQRIMRGLRIIATNNDGTAYSKSRVAAIVRALENEGFEVKTKRKLTINFGKIED